jgi:hypothetical protein
LIDRVDPDRLDPEDQAAWREVLGLADGLVDVSTLAP